MTRFIAALPNEARENVLRTIRCAYEDALQVPQWSARFVLAYHVLRMSQYTSGLPLPPWPEIDPDTLACACEALPLPVVA